MGKLEAYDRVFSGESEEELAQLDTRSASAEQQLKAGGARLQNADDCARHEAVNGLRADTRARAEVAQRQALQSQLEAEVAQHRLTRRRAHESLAQAERRKEAELAALRARLEQLQHELDSVLGSTIWRTSRQLRRAGGRLPPQVRRVVRGAAKVAWWTFTLRLRSQLAERRRFVRGQIGEIGAARIALGPTALPVARDSRGSLKSQSLRLAIERLRRFEPFSPEDYLRLNPDVQMPQAESYAHAICTGASEGRSLFDHARLARTLGASYRDRSRRPEHAAESDQVAIDAMGATQPLGHVAIYANSLSSAAVREIAKDVLYDLRDLGVRAELRDELTPLDARPPLSIYVAPHEFFTLGCGRSWARADVLGSGFMLSTERMQTECFGQALPLILMSRGVIDLFPQTAELFGKAAMPGLHLFPSTRRANPVLTIADQQHPLYRVLPEGAKRAPDGTTRLADRPIDIAFFGTESRRRHKFLARNAAFLAAFDGFIYLRPSTTEQKTTGAGGSLTRLATHVYGHAKVMLNIHRDEFSYFEWFRLMRLGMATGSVVVSEPCYSQSVVTPGLHYFEETERQIPSLLEWLLRSVDGQAEAERVRADAKRLVADDLGPRQRTLQLCNFLWEHSRS